MSLPLRAWAVIAVAALGGLASLVVAVATLGPGPTADPLLAWVVLTALVIASWRSPLVLYRNPDQSSEAIHLDEGILVVMVLVLPAGSIVLAFAAATIIAQVLRRRPLVKSVFNFGQVVLSVGLAVAAARAIGRFDGTLSTTDLLAAAVAAAIYFVVNSIAFSSILWATGSDFVRSLRDGLDIRIVLLGASVVVGLVTGAAVSAYPWLLPLGILPLLVLRQILAGHFHARHDRTRLSGLFEAALAANQSMGEGDIAGGILSAARQLLRCPEAAISETPPPPGTLGAAITLSNGDHRWLVVSGRSHTEPFDAADKGLLDALAAVGGVAITNAALYQEGRLQQEQLTAITSGLGEGVCALDREGRITFLNPAGARMLGWPADDDQRSLSPMFLRAPAQRVMENGQDVSNYDTTFERTDGSSFPVMFTASPIRNDHDIVGSVIIFRDITERKAFEEQLSRHAFQDPLTGLANRRLFHDYLDRALRRSQRSNESHAVLFADVDRFKFVNDSLGHQAGDQLLMAIANRLRGVIRPGDTLARFGGDEFTILLEGIADNKDAILVARRIRDTFLEPIRLQDGHEVLVTLSIGIALSAADATTDDVLRNADVAMYEAKANGHNGRFEVFDITSMGPRSAARLEMETALRHSLEHNEIEVFYQPVVDTQAGSIVGCEALIRWNHPQQGLLPPGAFINLAEETGLILPLGGFVLEEACRQVRAWRDRFGVKLRMSINLSAVQFQQPDLADQVRRILTATGAEPDQIVLEITESLAVADIERATSILWQLKELGVRLAIDDFGTGYSSLGYLKRFPVDVVKIDRSFVDGIDHTPVDSAIVAAVINLADTVGMTTVAEGVETEDQLIHLRALGCPAAQGYYFSRPLPADQIEVMLEDVVAGQPTRDYAAERTIPAQLAGAER